VQPAILILEGFNNIFILIFIVLAGCSRNPLRFTQKCAHFWERLGIREAFSLQLRRPLRGNPTRLRVWFLNFPERINILEIKIRIAVVQPLKKT
jgi:hypothetical protein